MTSSINYEREILSLETTANRDTYIESVTILLKILDNIVREPQNDKYRTIRLENKIIKEKLLHLNGVREFLAKIGFVEVRKNTRTAFRFNFLLLFCFCHRHY